MNILSKLNFIKVFLFLIIVTAGWSVVFSSCSSDDEILIENPEDPNNGSIVEEEGDEQEEIEIPEDFPDALAYVKLPQGLSEQVKEYTGFIVSFNKDNHTPNYVAWELLASEVSGSINRDEYDYWQDPEIEGCPTRDYAYATSGFQRGHMCPAADQKWSIEAMRDCMVMANMCPQLPEINEKAWATLEAKERQWAKRDGAIWIIAGPIYYETDTQRIGYSQVRVPTAFFKVFLYNDPLNPRTIAFVYPNGSAPGNMDSYAMSVDQLEKELGYDFFPGLPDEVEDTIEATYHFYDWDK